MNFLCAFVFTLISCFVRQFSENGARNLRQSHHISCWKKWCRVHSTERCNSRQNIHTFIPLLLFCCCWCCIIITIVNLDIQMEYTTHYTFQFIGTTWIFRFIYFLSLSVLVTAVRIIIHNSLNENRNSECVNSKKTHHFGVVLLWKWIYPNSKWRVTEKDCHCHARTRHCAPYAFNTLINRFKLRFMNTSRARILFQFDFNSFPFAKQKKADDIHLFYVVRFEWRAHFEVAINAIRVTWIQKKRNTRDSLFSIKHKQVKYDSPETAMELTARISWIANNNLSLTLIIIV